MKNILISGGGGYFGTFLTQQLLKDYNITVYDLFYFPWLIKNKKKIKYNERLKFVKKHLNEVKVDDFKDIDIVLDLNGISNDPSSELNPSHTWKLNNTYRKNFAIVARKAGVKRYIFNSTCSVYGFSKKITFEGGKKNPISTYAKANLKAEKYIYSLKNNNFKVNCLRNSTLFGFSNSMRLDLVVNIWVYNLIHNKNIVIDGDGEQYRPFLSLNDVTNVYKFILYKDKKLGSFICNLVSFNLKIKTLAQKILKIINNKNTRIIFNPQNKDKRNYIVGSKNFDKIFGKNFKFSSFKTEVKYLFKQMKANKIKLNSSTIRMKYYKKIL
jgi:nucleoside-diphosphate-sugar epimerase